MQRAGLGAGLAIGMGVGVALGVALDNMGAGVALGVGVGAAVIAGFAVAGARLRAADEARGAGDADPGEERDPDR